MGKGDQRTRKGKIYRGTTGKKRQKKRKVEIGRNKPSDKKASK
ncbi:MAG: 30S ribosomal protein THX [Calditrichaceae bacterium]